jgi:peptidoglycan/xylan/chitin deacetylase (PgdA/CDA1 family)
MALLAKTTICRLYKYSGAMHVQERLAYWAGQRTMVVVLFHRVTDDIPLDDLTVSTGWFRGFCDLMRRRFHVVTLSDVHRMLQDGLVPPMRTVAITFDDCYRDNYFAAKVLAEHGLPATFFVPTKYIGTDHVFDWDKGLKQMPNLTWDDVKEMQSIGHEIGSHSVTHPDFGVIDIDQAQVEMADSKVELENRLGHPVRFFAYPYGGKLNFRPEYNRIAREVGYDACFSAYGGTIQSHMRGHILPREAMPYFRSLTHLEVYLSGCLDWIYGFKRAAGMLAI